MPGKTLSLRASSQTGVAIRPPNLPPRIVISLSLRAGAHTGVAIRFPMQCCAHAHPSTNGPPFPSRRRGGACLSRAGWRGDSGAFGRNGRDFPFGRRCGIHRQVSGQASPSPTAKAEPFFPLVKMRAGRGFLQNGTAAFLLQQSRSNYSSYVSQRSKSTLPSMPGTAPVLVYCHISSL